MAKKRNNDGSLITPNAAHAANGTRVANLIVVRESDVSDKLLMLGMVDKTLYGCSTLPGVATVKTYGLEPFQNPEKFGAQLKTTSTHKMVLFAVEGTLFLYAMGSAAKEESDLSGNDFLEFLMQILKQYRPEVMTLANITRLMRSTRRVGELQNLLIEIGCVLRLEGGSLINVREPSGAMQFMMLTMFASFERDHIVMRMLTGIVAGAARGAMHFREEHLPLGYMLVGGIVKPDPERLDDVRNFLTILGQPLSRRQMAETMSSAGIRMNRSFGQNRSDDPGDARDMKGFIAGIEPWLDLYATGVHKVKRENPFIGLDRIGVTPVIRTSESDSGYIELNYDWGLPEGGWVSNEVLALARNAFGQCSKIGSGATGHLVRKPLLGLVRWTDENSYEWVLDSKVEDQYRLRRRLFKKGALPGWGDASIDGAIVARVGVEDLHKSIADGITKAITTGVATEKLRGHYIGQFSKSSFVDLENTLSTNALVKEEKVLRAQATRARKVVLDFAEEQDATPWIKEAIEFERRADAIQIKINDLQNTVKLVAQLEKEIPTDMAACARALSVLYRVENRAPRAVSDALGQILKDITIELTPKGRIQWRLYVLLPTSEGAVRLGPICGEVAPVLKKLLVTRSILTTGPRVESVLEVFRSGSSMREATRKVPDWSAQRVNIHVSKALKAKGLPPKTLTTLLNARVPELRMAVIGGVLMKPNMKSSDIPAVAKALDIPGCSLGWVEHVLHFYLFSSRAHFPSYWITGVGRRQSLLNKLLEAGGKTTVGEFGEVAGGGYYRSELTQKLLAPQAGDGSVEFLSVIEPGEIYEKVSGRITGRSIVKLVDCPHCGGFASRVIIVPELTRQLLCPNCRKMPTVDSPEFPNIYLEMAISEISSRKNNWDSKAISLSAEKYIASLPQESLAEMQIPCVICKRMMIKLSPNHVRCKECK